MSDIDHERRLPRWQFRYSLRTALIIITIVSLWLGLKAARRDHAAEVESWDEALRSIICENIAAAPAGTRLIDPTSLSTVASEQLAELGQLAQAVVPNGVPADAGLLTSWSPVANLDVAKLLETQAPIVVAHGLIRHYESGLAEHGMTRIVSTPGTCDPAESEPTSVWISDRPDLNAFVSLEVRVRGESATADVRIRHIARPIAHL